MDAILKVDDTWEVPWPVGDTLIVYLDCTDVLDGHDWTEWTFAGVATGLGVFEEYQDMGTTETELHKAMILTEESAPVAGESYDFAIRGTRAGDPELKETWWIGVLLPQPNPMEAG